MIVGTAQDDAIVRYALARQFRYETDGGLPLWPIDYKPIGAFPKTGFDPMVRFPTVAAGLRSISPSFRMIYDPHTKTREQPEFMAIHLYSEFGGVLLHETSCQWYMDRRWPHGIPCHPSQAWEGKGIVAWTKAHDKSRLAGDPEQIQRDINAQRAAANDAKRAKFDAEAAEMDAYVKKEMDKIVNTVSVGF